MGVAAPDGLPSVISDQADAYLKASAGIQNVAFDLDQVATNKLPAAWKGAVAETASEAVGALSDESDTAAQALSQAGQALSVWAGNLQTAQRNDHAGRALLQSAKGRLGPLGGLFTPFVEFTDPTGFAIAVDEARAGIASMVNAAGLAQNSGEATAAILNQLASQAGAERVDADGLDPLDAVVLANEQIAYSDGGGDILTAAQLTRASQHLSPDLADGSYAGAQWIYWPSQKGSYLTYSQANIGDCVAASNVVALANIDLVYMLKLTTGDQPWVPGSDSQLALVSRLQAAYISQYQQGQRADGDPGVYPQVDGGLYEAGTNALANSNLATATGTPYHYLPLNGISDNQAALPAIEKAVDSGQPVPLGIDSPGAPTGHEVVIIGASGNRLEVYNPWGSTCWITTQQFVNNQLTGVAPGAKPALPIATSVEMPSS